MSTARSSDQKARVQPQRSVAKRDVVVQAKSADREVERPHFLDALGEPAPSAHLTLPLEPTSH